MLNCAFKSGGLRIKPSCSLKYSSVDLMLFRTAWQPDKHSQTHTATEPTQKDPKQCAFTCIDRFIQFTSCPHRITKPEKNILWGYYDRYKMSIRGHKSCFISTNDERGDALL